MSAAIYYIAILFSELINYFRPIDYRLALSAMLDPLPGIGYSEKIESMPSVTVLEASKQSGLSVESIRTYCRRGRSNLIRHQDFFVRRLSPTRYCLMITPDGLKRLCLRAYKVRAVASLRPGKRARVQTTADINVVDKVRRWKGNSEREQWWRLARETRDILDLYLANPCAVPNCQCIIHRLGVPQLQTLLDAWNGSKHRTTDYPPWSPQKTR